MVGTGPASIRLNRRGLMSWLLLGSGQGGNGLLRRSKRLKKRAASVSVAKSPMIVED
ncbi:hypothetical protein M406DRAFT_322035 [Cryphonectria parasitica EP155]|uniref:Uncharacterized protein n=1 Tax=Cryphonectria parasitica (strain ATCC 38755 / EP155) TaxID=660469 RepID=A0A9P5CQ51_CRYP1|nr:uncharacterized protein M406DRAFT_322035 [Cryphonectria parasitica EP155]KAF3765665.1 hypothetical protein M406DRAFT_322035 [Cryphonectria parasitica EP155]